MTVNTGHLKANAVILPGEDSLSLALPLCICFDNQVEIIISDHAVHSIKTVRMTTNSHKLFII